MPDEHAAYEVLYSRGGVFLTPTPPHGWDAEIRRFLRDPDRHLIELSEADGQTLRHANRAPTNP